ncbi:MAG: glycoside hydrolase family 172 protein, partial [Planctomycetota bacterium]
NTKPPFNFPELVHVKAKGKNNFVPIPYQKSCKVVLEQGWGKYFQFTYTTFPEGTNVPSFTGAFNAEQIAALAKADDVLDRRGSDPNGSRPPAKVTVRTVTTGPGDTTELFNIKGPRAITAIKVSPDQPVIVNVVRMLRELTLSIKWDGESHPSVWSPLGDFFGTAPGPNLYRSLPLGITTDGWYSFWYMPFATSAVGQVTNDGKISYTLKLAIVHRPLSRPAEQLLRFHAKWHRDALLIDDKDRWPDWPVLLTKAKGRFCGFGLHVWNPKWIKSGYDGARPGHYWWGEGDEKFFVDGENFPSTFGTGTEDYFGFAWATDEHFNSAFQNQILNENNRGHISLSRFQIADNVPFQTSLEAVIEKYYPNEWNGNYTIYDTIAYWYQEPGTRDPYQVVPIEERINYYTKPAEAVPQSAKSNKAAFGGSP